MLDRIGILGSAICTVHCALPLLMSAFIPSASSSFGNEWVHLMLLLTVIPVALFSFAKTSLIFGENRPLFVGVAGVVLLILAILTEPYLDGTHINFELLLTVLGSAVLISAHTLNLKLISKICCP